MISAGIESLSPREREVLELVASHLTDAEIADRLMIAESTVHTHVHRILRKLSVKRRRHAARLLLSDFERQRSRDARAVQ